MKIIRIIARLNVGGPARHVVWLTEGLRGSDCESLLVAGMVPRGEDDMSYFAAQHDVTPIFLTEMSREISLKDALTVWKLYRLLLRERPDVVHTHTAKAGTVGRVAGFLYRWSTPGALIGRPRQCRFVHTYHGHIFHGYYGRVKTSIFLTIEKLLASVVTDRILVVSEQQRREIHETFGVGESSQFEVVPLGLDLVPFASSESRRELFRQELGVTPDEILIGIVGRLTEIKNHDLFLRAAALVKQKESLKKRLRFVVIGDGSLSGKLAEQSRSLGLPNDVTFAGNRNDPEVFYPALDVVALTSKNEGTPLTLIEAMANSRAIIATAVGGVVDLLGKVVKEEKPLYRICERGISVTPNDVDAFAAGLERLIWDNELRDQLGRNGFAYVTEKHSKDRLVSDIRSLYGDLLQERSVIKAKSPAGRMESRI